MTDLIARIRDSIIGEDTAVQTPFGLRRVIYADYTASGRSLRMIEDFITDHVLPMYANTHTETSGTGLQTTRFREDARSIIKASVGGGDEHAVIFAGSGSTGAIDRLIQILGIRISRSIAPVEPEPAKITACSSPPPTDSLMIDRASSRNRVVCSPVPDVSVWVLAYMGMTSRRMKRSMKVSARPEAM